MCRGSLDCLEQAISRRAFGRALRGEVASDQIDRLKLAFGSPSAKPEEMESYRAQEHQLGDVRG